MRFCMGLTNNNNNNTLYFKVVFLRKGCRCKRIINILLIAEINFVK